MTHTLSKRKKPPPPRLSRGEAFQTLEAGCNSSEPLSRTQTRHNTHTCAQATGRQCEARSLARCRLRERESVSQSARHRRPRRSKERARVWLLFVAHCTQHREFYIYRSPLSHPWPRVLYTRCVL